MIRKLFAALRGRRMDRDLADEIELHIAERAGELHAQGIGAREAEAQARRELGSTLRTFEDGRSAWTFQWIEELIRDLRYAMRSFRRSPGFVAAAVASLALGIGVNTSIFSLTMEFLFSRPSAVDTAALWYVRVGGGSHSEKPVLEFIRDSNVFDGVAGYREESYANWRDGDETYRLHPLFVNGDYFDVIRPRLLMGRGIAPNATRDAVVTYRFWQSRLGGDPKVLGRALRLNGEAFTIVGVLPPDHRTLIGFGFAPDLYLPHSNPKDPLAIYVRSNDSRPVVLEKMKALCARLDQAFPRDGRDAWGAHVRVTPVAGLARLDMGFKEIGLFFTLLLIVTALVLGIACANVSSLLLARAASRRQEMAVRAAIGAGRSRLVRQLLAESLLLTAGGTAAGLLINAAFTRAAEQIRLPLPVPIALRFDADWRLFAYAAAIAIVCSLLAGIAPALRSTGAAQLKADSRQTADSGGRGSIGSWLVPAQIAVSVILLTTGVLFLRNLGLTNSADAGFDAGRVAWGAMNLAPGRHGRDAGVMLAEEAVLRARAIPGVENAAVAKVVPFNGLENHGRLAQADGAGEKIRLLFYYNAVTAGYFDTMSIRMLDGSTFDASHGPSSPDAAVINEALARRVFGTVRAAGRRITFPTAAATGPEPQGYRIVGVCSNSKHQTLGEDQKFALYVPYAQRRPEPREINLLVRSDNPGAILRPLRDRLLDLDPTSAVDARTMESSMAFAKLPSQAGAALLGSIGVLGLVLAAVGLYGVLAFAVSRRTREIGVRLALGATQAQVSRLVLLATARLAGIGLAAGLAISAFLTEPLAMFLVPGLSPRDPVTFATVAAVLSGVALLASAGPVARAMRVDPIQAIRYE